MRVELGVSLGGLNLIKKNIGNGSDEEQTRTATVDAAEQKYHTHRLLQNERERDERKNTQTDLCGSP